MTDLARVVARDGVPFVLPSIPSTILDRLSAHRVVVVGETHLLREHREMMAELVRELHARGFRQLVLEWPHMVDWLLADFVHDGQLEPGWQPSVVLGGDMITAIRDFNRSLPEAEHIDVRAIDVNLQDYGGAREFRLALRALSRHLPSPGPVGAFLQGTYATPEAQAEELVTLRDELEASQSELVAAWGAYWYETVSEMVEVERASVPVRAMRQDHYDLSVRLRENVMKRLADLRLEGYGHGTVINVGSNHAQKDYLLGTSQEWLGDYLVHQSTAAQGSVIVLGVTPARVVSGSGGATTYDILDTSPDNELFRLMYETWSDQIVFLPLDDPVFGSERVPLNFEGTIYVCAPERHYDVLVVLPLAHRVPFT
ncbi:MAG: hypothetical protein HKM89_10225 [Gemmatimonadales bacterium]|nr:hypothetical protein [Gemmatimonadales bacterium]